ncbi:MAG: D-2-hydroxyacid dehydrogenase [Prevotella sp.]|nr:D-2-hydroxyacid dehydrogenase [Prevotella sp.]
MKIVVLDGYAMNPGDLSWEPMKQLGDFVTYDRTSDDQVIERAKDADIILTNKVPFDAARLKDLPKVRYIGVLATGYNIVDVEAAKELGILVTNIPAYSTDSVAQMTFAHILNVMNRVDHYAELNRRGEWSKAVDFCYWNTPLHELAGKTIGIVGLGSIGSKVAQIARVFGMDVFTVTSKNSADLPDGIQKTTLDGLFGISDVLSLHCPLTPTTHEMINRTTLAKMRKGAILVNTGRGGLINEADVAEALRTGRLSAYCADVLTSEPPAAGHVLFQQPNAFITPHIAWATLEARQRQMQIATENIRCFMEGQPKNVVNL